MAQAQAASLGTGEEGRVIRAAQGKWAAADRVWPIEVHLAGAVSRFLGVASTTLDICHLKTRERAIASDVTQAKKLIKATESPGVSRARCRRSGGVPAPPREVGRGSSPSGGSGE